MTLRRDGAYLVTGGLAGLGFAAARWLAEHGAGSLALLGGRGGQPPGAADRVAELTALGAEVSVYAGDVADPASLAAVLDEIRRSQPPLRGVVHAASAIGDALASELDGADIASILRPKLGGAPAPDQLTRDHPIQLFLMVSPPTTPLPSPRWRRRRRRRCGRPPSRRRGRIFWGCRPRRSIRCGRCPRSGWIR